MKLGLAFYSRPPDLTPLFRELSLRGFHRITAITRSVDDQLQMRHFGGSAVLWAVLGSLGLLLSAIAFGLSGALALTLVALVGLTGGWLFGRKIASGVSSDVARAFQKWVLRDETLVAVEIRKGNLEEALEVLRLVDTGSPAIFASRSFDLAAPQTRERRQPVSGERLKSEATRLARSHEVSAPRAEADGVLKRLARMETELKRVHVDLLESVRLEQAISPGAEWLLDNWYVIQAHIKDFRLNLPKRYTRFLPVIASERGRGTPRILQLARELIELTDCRLDRRGITGFIQAYQSLRPLTIAELWVLPLMLRLALLEALHERGIAVDFRQHEREQADIWANRLLTAARRDSDQLLLTLAELARRRPTLEPHFGLRLVGHLHDEESASSAVQKWLERDLDSSFAEIVRREQARQAVDGVSIANAIGSLRYLGDTDWRDIFESISAVDRILRLDPAGVYPRSDFWTRDRSRQIVEETARRGKLSESEVASRALELAGQADGVKAPRRATVSYYLLDAGRLALEYSLGVHPPVRERLLRLVYRNATSLYLTPVVSLAVGIAVLVGWIASAGVSWLWALYAALALLPASEISTELVNYFFTQLLPPRILPKMSYAKKGIPDDCRTLVVVPMMLLTPEAIHWQLESLEVNYLANPDRNVLYSLLSDFPDAPRQRMPEDDSLLELVRSGIEELDGKYGPDRFFLFHRDRVWSESEQAWIGWERKRGKLEELNCYLNQSAHPWDSEASGAYHPQSARLLQAGSADALRNVRFVITLDADTQMPPGAARRMIETISHPLNAAELGEERRSVVSGFGIIQPRVSASLPEAMATRFTRLFSSAGGTDPYVNAVSDLHQDLFGTGIYHGKAIYDVRVFHTALTARFPPSRLLSHDLIEGCYCRVGLASDIELLEAIPHYYHAWANRLRRWIRGDWQILDWVFPRVPVGLQGREWNPLTAIDRWKIFDNLRRSLVAPAAVALLLLAWFSSIASWAVVLMAFVYLLTPALLSVAHAIGRLRTSRTPGLKNLTRHVWRAVALGALLPHLAWMSLDAVLRVLRRRLSGKRLLEWETAQVSHWLAWRRVNEAVIQTAVICLLSCGLVIVMTRFGVWPGGFAFILIALWISSPAVADLLSRDGLMPTAEASFSSQDLQWLRGLARRTWRYFDDLVKPETNWLPPDNSQEALRQELAMRTSPTNIGLWLVSLVAAHDFGYVTSDQLVDRILKTLETIARLERYEGHLLNWYNIETLEPLRPAYVSTVDSGNLLGCYILLEQVARELMISPLLAPAAAHGIRDTLHQIPPGPLAQTPGAAELRTELEQILQGCERDQAAAWLWRSALAKAQNLSAVLANASDEEARYWSDKLREQLQAEVKLRDRYFFWLEPLAGIVDGLAAASNAAARRFLQQAGHWSLASFQSDWAELIKAETPWPAEFGARLDTLKTGFGQAQAAVRETAARIDQMRERLAEEAAKIKLGFLYDPDRRLFSIGYNPSIASRDSSYYDLLASEARLASLIAVARNDVPTEHWFALGRPFRSLDGKSALLSWSGTMFEYLMPLLLTRTFRGSLLDQACQLAVAEQVKYAQERGIPWGVSESAFSALDSRQIYQYRAFGVPALALKRETETPPVVTPYATVLALPLAPDVAIRNLRRLDQAGLSGKRGFYEAIDYSREGREGTRGVVVYAFMAHHQGMSLIAMDNALNGDVMPRRFHASPMIRAVESLLFEGPPHRPPVLLTPVSEHKPARLLAPVAEPGARRITTHDTPVPQVFVQSNGSLNMMVTNSGGGYTRWRDFDLSRWRADTTRDSYGWFCYIRDVEQGHLWSTGFHPLDRPERRYSVTYSSERAEVRRRDYEIETVVQTTVSPEDDAEIRLITLTNRSSRRRILELTSYVELALAPHAADVAHPAFQKLFVQTEAFPERYAVLAWRRKRAPEEPGIFAAQILAGRLESGSFEYETDREAFIGRGRSVKNPVALEGRLTGRSGYVLDPVFSLRARVVIEPGAQHRIAYATLAAESRERLLTLLEKYHDLQAAYRAQEMAWTHAQLQFRYLGIQADQAQQFQGLASHLLYPNNRLRPSPELLRRNTMDQSGLWAYGISGDLPILLLSVSDANDLPAVEEILLGHSYLGAKGLKSDLVILNQEAGGYDQPLQEQLRRLVQSHESRSGFVSGGGVFLVGVEQLSKEQLNLFYAVARVALIGARGSLAQQITQSLVEPPQLPPPLEPEGGVPEEPSPRLPFLELDHFNGIGGFTSDGREYVIHLDPDANTPVPWINVMANPDFGTIFSESGSGVTWNINSQNNRLTAWRNDPVTNEPSDVLYIRDEETGYFWTATPTPVREQDDYRIRHGQGYSVVEHNSHGIEQELTTFVPVFEEGYDPIRVQRLKLRNSSSRRRRLTVTSYTEIVLGVDREDSQMHIVTSWDPDFGALVARNTYHPLGGRRLTFVTMDPTASSYTCDRGSFLGRNRRLDRPAALGMTSLPRRSGAGFDPCLTLQTHIELGPHDEREVIVLLGQAPDLASARALVNRYADRLYFEEALAATRAWWDNLLSVIEVDCPDAAVNKLLNRWLLYQTISCRLWGRTALYQSGGAFGFRDQLQDSMAVVYSMPGRVREQLLRAASRQFVEGDVQHWWHEPSGAGVRTRCSDDLLWLAHVTSHYVEVTGDWSILDARIPFLEGPLLEGADQEAYFTPVVSIEDGSLFEHCRRALERSRPVGPHGLPLIGSGDWNDGMNRIGAQGRGESVWLAWFLVDVLKRFAHLCDHRQEETLAAQCRERATDVVRAIENHAWDGAWYLRAYFDDGTPVGSRMSAEARIDSLPQSWSVLAASSDPARARRAMESVDQYLVRKEDRLALIFQPPFKQSQPHPGYIMGYPPGVRENGGQYTHAALWVAMAHARLGNTGRAVELLKALSPIERTLDENSVRRYRGEPYAVAADVYSVEGSEGRAGWTWYTGSSGWMYRVWIEEVLGFKLRGDRFSFAPSLPKDWPSFGLNYRFGDSLYSIRVENPNGVCQGVLWTEVDGVRTDANWVRLKDDGRRHQVTVRMGVTEESDAARFQSA